MTFITLVANNINHEVMNYSLIEVKSWLEKVMGYEIPSVEYQKDGFLYLSPNTKDEHFIEPLPLTFKWFVQTAEDKYVDAFIKSQLEKQLWIVEGFFTQFLVSFLAGLFHTEFDDDILEYQYCGNTYFFKRSVLQPKVASSCLDETKTKSLVTVNTEGRVVVSFSEKVINPEGTILYWSDKVVGIDYNTGDQK